MTRDAETREGPFQRALRREMDLLEIQMRTIGLWHWPYPTLPVPATAEQRAEVDAEYRRLVAHLDGDRDSD